jgi:phytanoyl-CoA hydroxylase
MNTHPIQTDKDIALHDPRLYARRAVAPGIPGGFDGVTDAHVQQYRELGFLSIEDAFTPDEVRDGIAGLLHLIGGGNAEFKSIQFEAKAATNLDALTIEQKQDAVRKLMWFTEFEPRLKALSHHPKLLALVERLLEAKAPTMFQDMALLKPPRLGREKPWHQDKAYFNIDPRERVVGVWIALDAATTDNGCMHLLPQLPRQPIVHFQRRDWQICDAEILGNECVATPLRPGGLLLFDGLLVHGTPHNTSGQRRRAVQFHYHGSQFPNVRDEDRMALFGSEGKDVEC